MKRFWDTYFDRPFVFDVGLVVIAWFSGKHIPLFDFQLTDKAIQVSVLSSFIVTAVSLAGFILAALTIIVTFKASLNAKGIEESNNGMEMILSSVQYKKIVQVFKDAIAELTALFLFLYACWAASENLSINTVNRLNYCSIIITTLVVVRSLFVLFNILNLSFKIRK